MQSQPHNTDNGRSTQYLKPAYDFTRTVLLNMNDNFVSDEDPEWEQVHAPFSAASTAKLICNNGSLVIIKDDFYGEQSAFPPEDHEDLLQQLQEPEPEPPSPSVTDDNQHLQEPELEVHPASPSVSNDGLTRSKRLQSEAIQNWISQIVDRVRKSITCKAGYMLVALTAGGVAAAVLVLYMRRRILIRRQRRMQLESCNKSLMLLVREKDKRINELLLQIAQMNEVLLARRRVQVVHVK